MTPTRKKPAQTVEPPERNDMIEVLEKLGRLACVRERPADLIRRIVSEVPRIVKVKRVSLMLIQGDGLISPANIGLPSEFSLIPDLDAAPVVKWVVEHQTPLIVDDISIDQRFAGVAFERSGGQSGYSSQAFVSLPMIEQGRVIGVLNLTEREDGGFFSREEVRLLGIFGDYLAFALRNAILQQRLRKNQRRLKGRIQEIRILYRLVTNVSKALELESLARLFVKLVPAILGVRRASIVLRDVASGKLFILESVGVQKEFRQSSSLRSTPVIEWVLKHQRPLVVDDIATDPRFSEFRKDGYQTGAFVSIPLFSKDDVIGVLSVSNKRRGKTFSPRDVKLIGLFSQQLGVTLANIYMVQELRKRERLQEEMNIARMIQQQFLPLHIPGFPGVECAARLTSAEEIGGDLYHFVERDDGRFAVFIGDVSGKGIPAALTMVLATSHMTEIARSCSDPTIFMTVAHRLLCQFSHGVQYVTVAMVIIDADARTVEYALAGHPPILHFRASTGTVEELDVGGMPLGLYEDTTDYPFGRATLAPGDRLMLYTDGVMDARDRFNDSFGRPRLRELFQKLSGERAGAIVEKLAGTIDEFMTGMSPYDDTTMVCLGVEKTA